jgi:hypothetical protein
LGAPMPLARLPSRAPHNIFIQNRHISLIEYIRESFIAGDGEPRFFWSSENEPYGWAIRSTVRNELLRLAQPKGEPIYHYKSLEGFQGIVESQDLWLTESAFMNDASEIEHGIELSREVFEAIAADGSPIADALRKLTSLPVLSVLESTSHAFHLLAIISVNGAPTPKIQ